MKQNEINCHELAIRTGIPYLRLRRAFPPSGQSRLGIFDADLICLTLGTSLSEILANKNDKDISGSLVKISDDIKKEEL